MQFGINTLDDIKIKGKTILLRVDINQPVDKRTDTLKDISRIKACIPTIKELSNKGAKLVLLAHQGSDIEYKNFYTTRPHSKVLSELLDRKVLFVEDVCGPTAIKKIKELEEGEILLLDNVRFQSEEQTLFELKLKLSHQEQSKTRLVNKLAPLADIYICDAFAAAHRNQPSLCGFEQILPCAMGRLFEKEYTIISKVIKSPQRPCVFILGGAKVSDAFVMMESVLEKKIADIILVGGLIANIMLASQIDIGQDSNEVIAKLGYDKYIETSRIILEKFKDKIMLPEDLAYVENDIRKEIMVYNLPSSHMLIDIGKNTVKSYQEIINEAKTVFINGPMGIFEEKLSEYGTKEIWNAIGNTDAYTIVGGGDSITASNKYEVTDKISYICTGGGSLIRFLSGEELPVVKALKNNAFKNGGYHGL